MAGDSENQELFEAAVDAATKLFNDTSVSQRVTVAALKDLIGEIEILIESIEDAE